MFVLSIVSVTILLYSFFDRLSPFTSRWILRANTRLKFFSQELTAP